ncbi:MAG: PTS transporter subunit EIIC, partial [Negativicutes bacterium]|nr:PTS transporter subunit EIIC [Negativicutes bacterium]
MLTPIMVPIMFQFLAANVQAQTAGQPLPYITAYGFANFINVGGTGATLALVVLMMRSREAGFRQLGRMAFPPACFGINEPITFGLPIVLNPLMMIPYIAVPLILTVGTYLLMDLNLIGRPYITVPWTTPPILNHYLVTGGDWRAALWGLMSLVIALAGYYPFFRALEKQRLGSEGDR